MKENVYLASKPRYEILDGLRGVASVIVVLFHLLETYSAGPAYQVINHGYLAVDFFFVLSGFVIGYAYDDRWNRMTTWGFFKRRLVRLHPMVLMGTVLGACFYFFAQGDGFPLIGHVPGWKVALAFLMGLLMIPCGPRMDIRGWGETNSFNGPNWSLTWEYVGNILYAFFFRRLSKALLALFVAAAAFCTLDLCLNWNVFGLLTEGRNAQIYTVIGGWSLTSEQVYIGLTRLFYPFLCGLLISRIGHFVKVRGDVIEHIGGLGIGGGTILGLSKLLLKTHDFHQIEALAELGSLEEIDLHIRDITPCPLPGLPLDVTASIFGKADTNAKMEDIALGIVHMVLQTIGQGAVFASLNDEIKNIVLIGNLTRLPQCADIFSRLEEMYGVCFKIPKYAEYRTAIGAALCYIRNREYRDIAG